MEETATPIQPIREGPKLPKFKLDLGSKKGLMTVGLIVVLVGALSGWGLSKGGVGRNILGLSGQSAPGVKQSGNEVGLADEATFKDSAEGVLEEGGVDGEGTHHLVRPGGPSQNVYLTSTVIDLQAFVGKKVKILGQTIGARQAGWLMDVGLVKVIE